MWRSLSLTLLVAGLVATPALADPAPGDDVTVCRDRQGEQKAREDACERLIADGQGAGQGPRLCLRDACEALFK